MACGSLSRRQKKIQNLLNKDGGYLMGSGRRKEIRVNG
nr:MAG TPA: hypothetical protein [Caudoviricetes sp.]